MLAEAEGWRGEEDGDESLLQGGVRGGMGSTRRRGEKGRGREGREGE
jgi:hypothetical protein